MCELCEQKSLPIRTYNIANKLADIIFRKKYEDNPVFFFMDWIILQEEKLQLLIEQWLDDQKNETIKKFDELAEKFTEKRAEYDSEYLSLTDKLNKFSFDPKIIYAQFWNFRFERYTFPIELKDIIKSGNKISDNIEIISAINTNPFLEAIDQASLDALSQGGQSAFTSININIQFNMRDKLIENAIKNSHIVLSDQVKQNLQSKIKFELYTGVKNGESLKQLRDRVLSVYDKPITVNVPPKIKDNEIIRSGYSYQMSPKDWAAAVAGTEVAKGFMEGKLEGYRQMGVVEQVQFITTPDERMCEQCGEYTDKVFRLDEAGGLIPLHPRCRCTLIPYFPKENIESVRNKATENINNYYAPDLTSNLVKYEDEIADLKKGKLYIVDKNGNMLYTKTGSSSKIKINKDVLSKIKDNIITHNHTMGNPAFSSSDISLAIKFNAKQMRAVSGKTNQIGIMTRPKNGWGNIDYNNIAKLYEQVDQQIALENSSKILSEKLDSAKAELEHYINVNKRISEQLGYKFNVVDLKRIKKSMKFYKSAVNDIMDEPIIIDDSILKTKHYTKEKLKELFDYYEYFKGMFDLISK